MRRPFDPDALAVVSFDLDGTLLDSATAWREGFRAPFLWLAERAPALAALGDPGALHDGLFQGYLREAHARAGGDWSPDYVREGWRLLLARHAARDNAAADAAFEQYEAAWPPLLRLFDDAAATLQAAGARYSLVLITNGSAAQQRMKIEALDLARWFAHVVVSEEAGLLKPDPAIFAHAIAPLGAAPAAALHVGDTRAHDIAGARAAGWRSAWVNRHGAAAADAHEPDVEIAALAELLDLLGLR